MAERTELCPSELSLVVAEQVDLLICDHNYVYGPEIRLQRFVDPRPSFPGVVCVIDIRPGNYIACFLSFDFLESARGSLVEGNEVLPVHKPGMERELQHELLSTLRRAENPVLVLAVLGGVFAEGIDLPGEALIGAIIVGPSLPRVCFEREQIAAHYQERGEDGFERAMLYPGMQRVVQAAG